MIRVSIRVVQHLRMFKFSPHDFYKMSDSELELFGSALVDHAEELLSKPRITRDRQRAVGREFPFRHGPERLRWREISQSAESRDQMEGEANEHSRSCSSYPPFFYAWANLVVEEVAFVGGGWRNRQSPIGRPGRPHTRLTLSKGQRRISGPIQGCNRSSQMVSERLESQCFPCATRLPAAPASL
jgi:hypothetical protein